MERIDAFIRPSAGYEIPSKIPSPTWNPKGIARADWPGAESPQWGELEAAVIWAYRSQERFIGRCPWDSSQDQELGETLIGYWPTGEWRRLCFHPSSLREFLTDRGADPKSTLRYWRENNLIKCHRSKFKYGEIEKLGNTYEVGLPNGVRKPMIFTDHFTVGVVLSILQGSLF